MKFDIEKMTVKGPLAERLVPRLVQESMWFAVQPLPDDEYEIATRAGELHRLGAHVKFMAAYHDPQGAIRAWGASSKLSEAKAVAAFQAQKREAEPFKNDGPYRLRIHGLDPADTFDRAERVARQTQVGKSADPRRELLKSHKITATQAKLLCALAKYPMPTRADDLAVRKFMRTVQVGTYNNLQERGLIVGRVPAGTGWALTSAGEQLVARITAMEAA